VNSDYYWILPLSTSAAVMEPEREYLMASLESRQNTLKGTGSSSTAMRCCTNGDGPLQRGEHVHGLEANPLSPIIAAY